MWGQQQWPQQQWAQGAAGGGWQQPAAQAAPAQQQAAPAAGGGGANEVGNNEKQLVVTGCTHATVGGIVRGSFTLSDQNHNRPAYKKDTQANGLDVMIYFWDERDGPGFSGWWFGPKIGGDQVWAYHPDKTQSPPKTGWKVPYDGPIDTTFVIAGKSTQMQQQQQASAPGKGYAANWQQAQGKGYQQQGMGGQQQQMDQMRQQQMQQLQENKRNLEEANKKRLDDQKAKVQAQREAQQAAVEKQRAQMEAQKKAREEALEAQRTAQQEAMQKRMDEQKRMKEELEKKKLEQQCALQSRRVFQKLRTATPETFEDLQKEVEEHFEKEKENFGSLAAQLEQEKIKALEETGKRISQIQEQRKKLEEAKAAAAKKKQEAIEKAEELVKEFDAMAGALEKSVKAMEEEMEPLVGDRELKLEEVEATSKSVDEAVADTREKAKACNDFVKENGVAMREAPKPEDPESKLAVVKVMARIHACNQGLDLKVKNATTAKNKAIKKGAARKKLQKEELNFKKYDKDKDGLLSRREVASYAKGEFKFTVPNDSLDMIFKAVGGEDGKGVKKENMQRLLMAIGVAREAARDAARRAEREKREQELAKLKATLEEKVTAMKTTLTDVEAKVVKVVKDANELTAKVKTMSSTEMLTHADEVDAALKEVKDETETAKKNTAALSEGVDKDLANWIGGQAKALDAKLGRVTPQLTKAQGQQTSFRTAAKKKDTDEVQGFEKEALRIIRYNQNEKKLTSEAIFAQVSKKKDGKIDEAKFVKFFASCDMDKEETKDEEDGEEAKERPRPSADNLKRLFKTLDLDESGSLPKDKFVNLIRQFMKVVKDTVITDVISIKDGKNLRRLEAGEVVEVIEGPVKEESAGVKRMHCKVMKDDLDGWITLAGNQGTVFLQEGGATFKVVKETIFTEAFELDGAANKESARKLKDTTRKLKVGEIVEVREWPRKEEKSGLMRMKCKAKSDGAQGWVTTMGNAGAVFLEVC